MACNIMMYQKHLEPISSPAAHIYLSNLGEAEKLIINLSQVVRKTLLMRLMK